MSKASKYNSDIKAAIHEIAGRLHDAGLIDKHTMRHFDDSCLTPVRLFSAGEIRALREREDVSQSVFASYLNVTKDSVSKWERGKEAGWSVAQTAFPCGTQRA